MKKIAKDRKDLNISRKDTSGSMAASLKAWSWEGKEYISGEKSSGMGTVKNKRE